jgi:ubiquinol-cytochrome c reductase cytochrome b subunit
MIPGVPVRRLQSTHELAKRSGCVLLLCTLGMAFTGQVLRFDQNAYWGLGIGVAILARTPVLGAPLTTLMLGGPIIGGETLSRFFTLHVFVIPGLIIALVSLHLRLVLTAGINEYPTAGKRVDPATYHDDYEALLAREGVPFVPKAIGKDLVFAGCLLLAILICAAVLGPNGPNGPPDPTLIETSPAPDFYFLPLFSAFALLPPYTETFLVLVGPVVGIGVLFMVPFLSNTGEKSVRRRPWAAISVILIMLTLSVLAYLGTFTPWSPVMDAWSGAPTPVDMVQGRSPLELQGALVLQVKQCRSCHSLDGEGGTCAARPRYGGDPPHPRPAHPPGAAGQRQHARTATSPPRRSHRAGGVHANLRRATNRRARSAVAATGS